MTASTLDLGGRASGEWPHERVFFEVSTRREFLKNTSRLAAVTSVAGAAIATQAGREALASDTLPPVHPGHSDTIQVALVGCGGRGTGAQATREHQPRTRETGRHG